MYGRNPESRDFVYGLVIVCLMVAGFLAYTHWAEPRREPRTARPARESSTVIATVYECRGENGRVLSDQPCGEDAKVIKVEEPNRMPAPAAKD